MISILLPIYNGIEFIDESISSIINQTEENWELLIGVNGHPKNSNVYLTAKQYENSKIKVYDLYHLKCKVDTLHELLKYTNYNWIALIDVDDIWLPNKLSKQIKYMDLYDIIGTNTLYFGESKGVPNLPYYDLKEFNFMNYNPIINSSVLLKKELCYWSKKYEGIEDYELWLRLWKQQKKFYNLPDILVKHRIHNQSEFNTKNFDKEIGEIKQLYS